MPGDQNSPNPSPNPEKLSEQLSVKLSEEPPKSAGTEAQDHFFREDDTASEPDESTPLDRPMADSGLPAESQPQRFSDTNPSTLAWSTADLADGHKNPAHYVVIVLGLAIITALIFWLTRSWFSAGAIALIGLSLSYLSGKRPHALNYQLDGTGIIVGQKHFAYGQFRSFSIVDEGGYTSIALMPLQRFLPMLSVRYDPQIHQQVVDILSQHLPLEEHKRDAMDRIISSFKL